MKKWGYILLGILVVCAGLYTLVRMAAKGMHGITHMQPLAQEQPPAPYPPYLVKELNNLPGIRVELNSENEVPTDICWNDGGDFPLIGSPQAKKGGVLRLSNVGPFPANFLAFGSPYPQFFHYNLFDRINIPLVRAHPVTGQVIPGLAECMAEHQGWLWFKLNRQARYSNGRPVRALDFALGAVLRYRMGETQLCQFASELRFYGDHYLAVKPRNNGPMPLLMAAAVLHPAEPDFYSEFAADYPTRYAQRIPPTTGAYTVGSIQQGRLVTLVKNHSWWAEDVRGFRYTHNPDKIEHHFLTDEAQTWEMFLRGRLDLMQTRNIVAWQEKLQRANEQIQQRRFRINGGMPPYGIALNSQTLTNPTLRRGLMQAMNMQAAMQIIFRGEAERLPQFAAGYPTLQHTTPTYEYNPNAARECFRQAGYTRSGTDGILMREDGNRLSVRLAYTPSEKISTLVTHLVQSAAICGAEIVPEPLPWQNCSDLVKDKRHEMIFWATVAGCPLPNYRQSFHSESSGDDAPFCLQNPEMDDAIRRVEESTTPQQTAAACAEVDRLIFELAIWLPGWMENRVNIAVWPHVHLPEGGFSTYDIAESHTLWIQE